MSFRDIITEVRLFMRYIKFKQEKELKNMTGDPLGEDWGVGDGPAERGGRGGLCPLRVGVPAV